ncbi:MAG: hemerythrin domain-containing protein [Pseudonocardia sp.]|nr:hemerythrin domain-containing protein [Pseudonocardia sp.]
MVEEYSGAERLAPASDPDDVTQLILDDHERFRRAFAALDELRGPRVSPAELSKTWDPLAELLDVHAVAEEEVFYPQLLRRGDDATDETLDAIGDHNDIRDAVREAAREPVGSPGWWAAVGQARKANDEHMAEEERDALADFRRNTAIGLRVALGRRFRSFKAEHDRASNLDTRNKDPEAYVEAERAAPRRADNSLGIGSLKGR